MIFRSGYGCGDYQRAAALALLCALLGAALLVPDRAGAQAAWEARLDSALTPRARAAVVSAVEDARRRALPTAPLLAKALEGVEKGAPEERIPSAVSALLARLIAAQAALAPPASEAELVAGADALSVGVPRDALRQLRALSGRRSATVALGVLAQLVSRGVPVRRAVEAVMVLLQRGAGPQQFLALERTVNGDMELGLAPDVALALRTRALIAGLSTGADAGNLTSTSGGGGPP